EELNNLFEAYVPLTYVGNTGSGNVTQVVGQRQDALEQTEMKKNSLYPESLDNIYKCPVCDKSFGQLSRALDHQTSHSTDHAFHCSPCVRSFKYKKDFNRHVRETHANQVDYLPLKTTSKQVRESEERGNPCPECDKNFARWDTLQLHLKSVHATGERHACPECGKLLSHKRQLPRHIREVHTRDYHKRCEQCGKMFSRASVLKKHTGLGQAGSIPALVLPSGGMAIWHRKGATDEGRFTERLQALMDSKAKKFAHWPRENNCQQKIAQARNTESAKVAQDDHCVDDLPQFSPSHTEKTYNSLYPKQLDGIHKCPMCDRSFAQLSKALEHQKSHSTNREFHCSLCLGSFKHKSALNWHMRKTHANQVDYQSSKTPSKQVRESEERGNPCPECDKNFASWGSLQRHRKSLHGKAEGHTCDECGKLLSHKRHLYQHLKDIHMKDDHNRCEQCGRTFGRSYTLKRHINCVHGEEQLGNR
ncbi:hypothetical protein CSKR_114369, partial [Clonorchis sinensis]